MARKELITVAGKIDEILPDKRFSVTLYNEYRILAYTAGKMRRHQIRSVVRDHAHGEVTPYDLTNGRIVNRERTLGQRPEDVRARMIRHYPDFDKAAATPLPAKDKMNYKTPGAVKHHTISPQKSPAYNESMERQVTFSAMLSTTELRRLVAAMVD